MKIIKKILLALVIIALLGGLALSFYVGKSVFDGATNATSREETIKNEKDVAKRYDPIAEKYEVKDLKIKSSKEDHEIPAIYLKKDGNENIAVMVHGMGGTKKTLPEEMDLFLERGFNVIAYDQRNAGENQAPYNSFGYLESYDALDYINYARKEVGDSGKVLLYGESYGGITSIIAAGREDTKIDYLVLDCPVTDGKAMLMEVLTGFENEMGIPASYMYFTGNLYTKMKLGFSYEDTVYTKWVDNINVPILLFSSVIDDLTPHSDIEEMYNAIEIEEKMLVSSETAKHASILQHDPDTFINGLDRFLEKY